MAITVTQVGDNQNANTGISSITTTQTLAAATGVVRVVEIQGYDDAFAGSIAISGDGLSYAPADDTLGLTNNGSPHRANYFQAAGNPTSGALTATFSGDTFDYPEIRVWEISGSTGAITFEGVLVPFANGVQLLASNQYDFNMTTSGGGANNALLAVAFADNDGDDFTNSRAGWTLTAYDALGGLIFRSGGWMWRADNDTTCEFEKTSASGDQYAIGAVFEFSEAAGGPVDESDSPAGDGSETVTDDILASETASEAGDGSEAVTDTSIAGESVAEAGDGSEAVTDTSVAGESVSEAGSGSEAVTEDVISAPIDESVAEAGDGSEAVTDTVVVGESVSETGSGSEAVTEDVISAPIDESVSEAGSGSEDAGIEMVFQTPDEAGSGSVTITEDVQSAATYEETVAEGGSASGAVTDSLIASETDAAAAEGSETSSDSLIAGEAASSGAQGADFVTEDVISVGGSIIDVTVSESGSAQVSPESLLWADEFIAAVAGASESLTGSIPVDESVSEAGAGSHAVKDEQPVSGEAWAFVLDGHVFYVLNDVGGKTLVYDATTGQWHHWYTGVGPHQWNMFLGTMWNGNVIAADAEDGVLWELDPESVLDEGTEPINRAVTAFVPIRGKASARQGSLRLTGSVGAGDATTATVHMRFSDDEGRTWSTPRPVTLNVSGPGRIEWRSLGRLRSPGRIWEIVDVGGLVRVEGVDSDMEGS